jgi:DNA-directed RNA polymerase subunit RPC12/RpoP
MAPPPIVRIPLQVGVGSVKDLAAGALFAVSGLYGILGAVPIADAISPTHPDMFGTAQPDPGFVSFLTMAVSVGAACVMLLGLRRLARAIARRPSDLVVTADGVAFLGGRHGGFSLEWRDVQGARWEIAERRGTWTLRDGPDDDAFEIAKTSSEDEADAFEETTDALHAMARGQAGAVEARALRTGLLDCMGCGAPLRPTDAEAATCDHCGARTVVSADVRERLRKIEERRERDRETDRAVALCLAQPHASTAGATIGAAGGVTLVVAVIWGAYLWRTFFAYALHAVAVVASLLLVLAMVLGASAVALAVVGARRSLHVVTLAIGALAPSGAHGIWSCRRCGGPLAQAPGVAIVACDYCGAPNVVGVDLVGLTAKARDYIIEDALDVHRRRRRNAALLAALGACLLLAGVFASTRM